MERINVTKSYLPPFDEYIEEISTIWDNHFLTNNGPLTSKLTKKLEEYLNLQNIHLVTNGTMALQLSLDSLNITEGEIITTPFTFVATISAIVWQRCKPVFVDINEDDFNVKVEELESKITKNTKAIMLVHCFGYPCDVEKISLISKKYKIPVIYDAAHSFGTKLNGKSIFNYGDIATCSLHATKVFHTIEGGLCVANNAKISKKMKCIKNFGIENGKYKYVGINAKISEFNAAMGICVLNHFNDIIKARKKIYDLYVKNLSKQIKIPIMPDNFEYNYLFFPVLFKNKKILLNVVEKLNKNNIYPRRYFYPCINDIPIYKNEYSTPIAKKISLRILCLPIDTYLTESDIKLICNIVNNVVEKVDKQRK